MHDDSERYTKLCSLFEAIWLKRSDEDYYDIDTENLPAMTSPQAFKLATWVLDLFDQKESMIPGSTWI